MNEQDSQPKPHEQYPANNAHGAIIKWADNEIIESSNRISELLRFLFIVSSSSLVTFISIAKLADVYVHLFY